MMECYYQWCQHHHKDEPFCKVDGCIATAEDIKRFYALRVAMRPTTPNGQEDKAVNSEQI